MKTKTLIAAIAIAALAIVPGTAAAHPGSVKTTCRSAATWGPAPDSARPCTTVMAPDNDQVRVIQGTASREEAECVVDIADVIDAHCHTIDANRAAPTPIHTPAGVPDSAQAVCTVPGLCAAITTPEEDGSGRLVIHTLGHVIRCTLSNPAEEQGAYRVPCHLTR